MIKLKDIWVEMLKESVDSGNFTEIYDYTGIYIPALVQPNDVLEIVVDIDYDYKPGVPPSYHNHVGENEQFTITGWEIVGLTITSKDGKKREIDNMNIIHPVTEKTLKSLVKKNIESGSGGLQYRASGTNGE